MRFVRCSVQVRLSTGFLVLSSAPPPYRVENWSPARTLALRFQGSAQSRLLPPLSWWAFSWPTQDAQSRRLSGKGPFRSRRDAERDTRKLPSGLCGGFPPSFQRSVFARALFCLRLIVQDIRSQRGEMYDADEVGPRAPLDLSQAEAQVTGATAPLTEDGYHAVVVLLDTGEMAKFAEIRGNHLSNRYLSAGFLQK